MKDAQEIVCGIEIHQQLSTRKLFCSCESRLCDEGEGAYFRKLRPTTGESGEIDRAALAQYNKGMGFRYQMAEDVSCLVDLDEEPPSGPDPEALETALVFSEMLHAKIADEIHFMRKVVVDGSNTGGYQRSALISTGGWVEVNGRRISILSVCLEEDAARKIEEKDGEITFRLDRLGIPLIEVATGPDIRSPEEAMETALRIGTLLRATKRVKRGIGTIREDLNISIPGGARVELKGAQELRMLPDYVANEAKRQKMLLTIKDILIQRGTEPADTGTEDVTDIFAGSESKVIKGALSSKGKVLAVRLPGFAGVMNGDGGNLRLGAEMAQRARSHGVKGIFHSDELPAYGIEQRCVDDLIGRLGMNGANDAFAICAAPERKARSALTAAVERANEALTGVPEETRDPLPDGTSKYSRPLPGASRMYPETDVPPIGITDSRLDHIRADLPELPEETEERLIREHGVNRQQARQLVRQDFSELFERICSAYSDMSAAAATTFLNTYSELERSGVDTSRISEEDIMAAFSMLSESKFAKEALPEILKEIAAGTPPEKAPAKLGLESVDDSEAQRIIESVVKEREEFVRSKGKAAAGPLMGPVMESLRGKVDGKKASRLLSEAIEKLIG
ncbi:MAG: Glu-tRNA(Gln) amidotransferase subunit GatE [Thermoplasmatales archaeon]|nr:Glu-tRNA(Gln) amidotransferase subunit GatE [Thermoplasmatales archaeon]